MHVSVHGAKTQLSKLLDLVEDGEEVVIERHGRPAFIKIDVEGFEVEALAGLSRAVQALSFEFTTIQRDVAFGCLARCTARGYRHYKAALGESQSFVEIDERRAHRESFLAKPRSATSLFGTGFEPQADGLVD